MEWDAPIRRCLNLLPCLGFISIHGSDSVVRADFVGEIHSIEPMVSQMHKIYEILFKLWSALWETDMEPNPIDGMSPSELADLPPFHEPGN